MRLLTSAVALVLAFAILIGCGGSSEVAKTDAAKQQIDRGDVAAAIVTLKGVLQANPQSAPARFLLGRALFERGDVVAAKVELEKAMELGHDANAVVPMLAKTLLLTRQSKKLLEGLGQRELSQPQAIADLKTTLALARQMAGDSARSEAELQAALKADPRFAPARILHARNLARAGEFDASLAILNDVIAIDPARFEAIHIKGEILLGAKNDEAGATAAFEAAIARSPKHVPSHGALISNALRKHDAADAKQRLNDLKKAVPNHPQTLYFESQLALLGNDVVLARERMQQLLRVAPDDVRALQLSAVIETRLGALTLAETRLVKALTIDPTSEPARIFLAQNQVRAGEFAKALASIAPVLQGRAPPVAAIGVAAEANLHSGNNKLAAELFERAAKANPQDVRYRTALALGRIARGGAERGFAELEAIAAADDSVFADMALITERLRVGQLDAALGAADRMVKKSPQTALPHFIRGRVMLQRKDTSGARASFEAAIAADGAYMPAVTSLADLDVADGKVDAAIRRFEAVLVADTKSGRARLAIADLKQKAGAKPEETLKLIDEAVMASPLDPQARIQLVNHHLAARNPKAALSAAETGVAAVPGNMELLDALGRAQIADGSSQQAMSTFRTIATALPRSPQPLLRIAQVQLSQDDRSSAIKSLRQALQLAPGHLNALEMLFGLNMAEKRFPDAFTVARDAQKRHPERAEGWVWEGQAYAAQRNWDAAGAAFRSGLQRSKSTSDAMKLHAALASGGKRAEAERFAQQWQADKRQDIVFMNYLGDTALAGADLVLAERNYLAVIAAFPNHVPALNNLAWVTVKLGKPGGAAYAKRAADLLPGRASLLDTLAVALAAEGQFAKALEVQKSAIALDPQSNVLKLTLARVAIQAGDKALAKRELEKLAWLGEKFPAQSEVAELLKSVQ